MLSVHSRGYWQPRGRAVQLTTSRISAPDIQLTRVGPEKTPVAPGAAAPVAAAAPAATELAGFGALDLPVPPAALSAPGSTVTSDEPAEDGAEERGETAWRLRHLPRSILKETPTEAPWVSNREFEPRLFSDLALSGQINLLTTESFNSPGQLLGAQGAHGVAFVSVGTQAAGAAWAMQGAMTQGDLAS